MKSDSTTDAFSGPSSRAKQHKKQGGTMTKKQSKSQPTNEPVKLLSGGNPQIAKADGDAAVQKYIAAMPNWKCEVGRRLDAIITETRPDVRKAIRWNTPFYGIEGQGWFLGFHCFAKFIKVSFLRGALLQPLPPVESRQQDVRYVHFSEGELIDEQLFASWIRQAAAIAGVDLFR
jgi:hypothetical protein